jgi:hydroxymethylpyrimidine pyrophosphatase-like HAD family hydrolase
VLGVGDTTGDWKFMQLCHYAAAMGNASNELKELVETKGEDNFFIAPHVDNNGILEVFKHFSLL